MEFETIINYGKEIAKDKMGRVILGPLDSLIDENVADVISQIGLFTIRKIRGKFARTIQFAIGRQWADNWMEEALYGILYKYNDIKKSSSLELTNPSSMRDGSGLHYRLSDGTHTLKYKFLTSHNNINKIKTINILVSIISGHSVSAGGRNHTVRTYNITTYNLDPEFVVNFENDMIKYRNSLLKIRADSPTFNIYKDYNDNDGWAYWSKGHAVNKRKLNTIYLPMEVMTQIIDTVNNFFSSKQFYIDNGIPWNLKILLYGLPGTGKDSIAKMIASEWNRNLYYVTGGKGGKYIPNSLTSDSDEIISPLFLISDIDKYPFLINEPDIDLEKDSEKEHKMDHKQLFNKMINALDGALSPEGRIIVMSTNHIEKFSPTFLRPGRIDLCIEIPPVGPEVFRKYVYNFYGKVLPKNIELKSKKLSMAELQFDFMAEKLSFQDFIKKHVSKIKLDDEIKK